MEQCDQTKLPAISKVQIGAACARSYAIKWTHLCFVLRKAQFFARKVGDDFSGKIGTVVAPVNTLFDFNLILLFDTLRQSRVTWRAGPRYLAVTPPAFASEPINSEPLLSSTSVFV